MNENTFKQYIYENICQCHEQCLPDDNYQIKKQDNCKEITPFDIKDLTFYNDKIDEILQYFLSSNLLIKVGNKYYIITDTVKLRLTWENVKTLNDTYIQKLFWLFRKSIVDLLLKKILVELNLDQKINFKIYSVGSNNLSSDYDITLYGDTQDKGNVITTFEKEFKNIFYDHSSLVFDTNIYGKSFVSFEKNNLSTEFMCNNDQPIFILNESSEHPQLVWALVKYFQDIRNSFGESIFNSMIQFLIKHVKLPHITIAFETRVYLNNKDPEFIQYNKLFSQNFEKNFIKTYKSELQASSDYTSLLNFYGNETYFTRGAFLDTVINKQMCKNKIQLKDVDYISSILENSGFFFLHNNKTKYFIRVVNTLSILCNNSDKYKRLEYTPVYEKIKKILDDIKTTDEKDNISYDDKYCNWIDENTFDLLKCEKYTIFNLLLKINYEILKIFNQNYEKKSINIMDISPFYYHFVKKNTTILGKEISQEFSTKTRRKSLDVPLILEGKRISKSRSDSNIAPKIIIEPSSPIMPTSYIIPSVASVSELIQ